MVPGQNGFVRIQTFTRRLWLLCIYSMTPGHDLVPGVVEATQTTDAKDVGTRIHLAVKPLFLDFESDSAFAKSIVPDTGRRQANGWSRR